MSHLIRENYLFRSSVADLISWEGSEIKRLKHFSLFILSKTYYDSLALNVSLRIRNKTMDKFFDYGSFEVYLNAIKGFCQISQWCCCCKKTWANTSSQHRQPACLCWNQNPFSWGPSFQQILFKGHFSLFQILFYSKFPKVLSKYRQLFRLLESLY